MMVRNDHWDLHEELIACSYSTDLTRHYVKMARRPAMLFLLFGSLGKNINLVISILFLILFCRPTPLIDRHPVMLFVYVCTTGFAVMLIWDYFAYYYIIVLLYNLAVCCTLLILRPKYDPSFRI